MNDGGPTRRAVLRAVLFAAGLGLAIWLVAREAAGLHIPYPLVAAVMLALTLGNLLLTPLRPPPPLEAPIREDGGRATFGLPDRPFTEVRRWEDRLDWARGDPEHFARTVVPVIGVLVDERLRLAYGVTRASDPQRAREILGDGVWQFLDTDQPRRVPSPAELALLVTELEQL